MNIRNVLLASAAAFFVASSAASAADLPVRSAAPAPVVAMPFFTWQGFYIGAHIGYGSTVEDKLGVHHYAGAVRTVRTVGGNLTPDGILGGLQLGYNWQSGALVYGLELDGTLLSGKSAFTGAYPAPIAAVVTTRASKDWTGSLRARLGYAAGRALFFVTGGVALTDVKYSISPVGGIAGSTTNVRISPVVGAGIEYAFDNNWSAKVEGLYTFMGKETIRTASIGGNSLGTFETQSHWQVRLGLNYRFGGPVGPVVAKY